MISIAICDDEKVSIQLTTEVLTDYIEDRHLDAKISSFMSPNDLKNQVIENGPFDIYILDQLMPDVTGIELAKFLRANNAIGEIIFLSAAPSYVFDSFKVHPLYYHLKPLNASALYETLDEAVSHLSKETKVFDVHTQRGTHRVSIDKITYIEHKERRAYFFLNNGKFVESTVLRSAFSDLIAPITENSKFTFISSSVLVNLEYVTSVTSEEITLVNGTILYPSRAFYPKFNKIWKCYHKK